MLSLSWQTEGCIKKLQADWYISISVATEMSVMQAACVFCEELHLVSLLFSHSKAVYSSPANLGPHLEWCRAPQPLHYNPVGQILLSITLALHHCNRGEFGPQWTNKIWIWLLKGKLMDRISAEFRIQEYLNQKIWAQWTNKILIVFLLNGKLKLMG